MKKLKEYLVVIGHYVLSILGIKSRLALKQQIRELTERAASAEFRVTVAQRQSEMHWSQEVGRRAELDDAKARLAKVLLELQSMAAARKINEKDKSKKRAKKNSQGRDSSNSRRGNKKGSGRVPGRN